MAVANIRVMKVSFKTHSSYKGKLTWSCTGKVKGNYNKNSRYQGFRVIEVPHRIVRFPSDLASVRVIKRQVFSVQKQI